jgi:hypothetical protein
LAKENIVSEQQHSKTPWLVVGEDYRYPGIDSQVNSVVIFGDRNEETGVRGKDRNNSIANARRIVACVNALDGVSTEHLEQYGLPDFAQKISDLAQQRDELLHALKEVLSITGYSHGVTGYHLNGQIAEWGEFEEVSIAEAVIAKVEAEK